MLSSYRATYLIITLFTAHISIVLASDNDSEPTTTPAPPRQRRSSLPRSYQKKIQRKDYLHTFSDQEITTSWLRTMAYFQELRDQYGSNQEHLARIKQEQNNYTSAYQEVAKYRTFSPTRLQRLEESASYLPMYFDTEPMVCTKQSQHYQASLDRYSAFFDLEPVARLLQKHNNNASDETDGPEIFAALTSALPIEQNV